MLFSLYHNQSLTPDKVDFLIYKNVSKKQQKKIIKFKYRSTVKLQIPFGAVFHWNFEIVVIVFHFIIESLNFLRSFFVIRN